MPKKIPELLDASRTSENTAAQQTRTLEVCVEIVNMIVRYDPTIFNNAKDIAKTYDSPMFIEQVDVIVAAKTALAKIEAKYNPAPAAVVADGPNAPIPAPDDPKKPKNNQGVEQSLSNSSAAEAAPMSAAPAATPVVVPPNPTSPPTTPASGKNK